MLFCWHVFLIRSYTTSNGSNITFGSYSLRHPEDFGFQPDGASVPYMIICQKSLTEVLYRVMATIVSVNLFAN